MDSFITKRLKDHASAQVYVRIYGDGTIQLVSYWTTVIEIDPAGWLVCYGLYSRTTSKHIGWFMREYANSSYYTAKDAFLNGMRFNIHTGEIQPIETAKEELA